MIDTFTTKESLSLLLENVPANLRFNHKLETVWKKGLVLKSFNPTVYYEKSDFLIHEIFVLIILIALSFWYTNRWIR